MFELLRIAIALIGSTAAGLWDLKTTDIPDWVCVLIAVCGVGLFAVQGWMTGDFSGLTMSLLVGGLFAAFGIGMYLTGQWGGGDGELMVAIGMLLPFWPVLDKSVFAFPVAFFINVFFVGSIYTIIYAGIFAARRPELKRKTAIAFKSDKRVIVFTFGVTISFLILWLLTGMSWVFITALTPFPLLFLYHMLKEVEKSFYIRISVKKLKVGDMLGENMPKIKLGKLHIRGLTEKEIRKIKSSKKFVTIREGIRFGPVFPLTLALTLIIGDFVTFIMLGI